MSTIEIKKLGTHGWYQTTAEALDLMIERYLPRSVAQLRKEIAEDDSSLKCGGHYDTDDTLTSGVGIGEPVYCDGTCQYADLTTVTECLMILAALRGYATN